MTSVQYLTRVGDVLNIQVEKVYGYDEWLQALDQGNICYVNGYCVNNSVLYSRL